MERKPLTPPQTEKFADLIRVALRKNNPFSDEAQDLIENHWDELKDEMLEAVNGVVKRAIERKRNTIIRAVKVNRSRLPQEMLDATGRAKYLNDSVVEGIPRGEGNEEVTVEFFKLGRYVSDNELEKEYTKRGLTPDPYAVAAVNEADPAFADEHPNGVHWKDENGRWCYITFDRYYDGRSVGVYLVGDDWFGSWWFGGVRK